MDPRFCVSLARSSLWRSGFNGVDKDKLALLNNGGKALAPFLFGTLDTERETLRSCDLDAPRIASSREDGIGALSVETFDAVGFRSRCG